MQSVADMGILNRTIEMTYIWVITYCYGSRENVCAYYVIGVGADIVRVDSDLALL